MTGDNKVNCDICKSKVRSLHLIFINLSSKNHLEVMFL